MHMHAIDPARAALALAALLTLGCGDSTAPLPAVPPPTGTVVVTVTTTSTDGEIDPDGYSLFLGTEPVRSIAANDEVTFAAVPGGRHILHLTGLASNCAIQGGNSIAVDVPRDKPTPLVPVFVVVICGSTEPSPWDY